MKRLKEAFFSNPILTWVTVVAFLIVWALAFLRASRDEFGYVKSGRAVPSWDLGVNHQVVPVATDNTAPPVSFSSYSVVDAFPGVNGLAGAMQLRPYPGAAQRWLVATFTGKLVDIEQRDDKLHVRTILDIAAPDHGWLYSFALHPQFGATDNPRNWVFVFYRNKDSEAEQFYRVSAFELDDGGCVGLSQERVLIHQRISHLDHLGGSLEFDRDGFLLISVGDNGRVHDDSRNSQKIDAGLFSGILRIDIDGHDERNSFVPRRTPRGARTGGYRIPVDNPFVSIDGANHEFWAIGLRSPFRISSDRVTGKVWIGEVGQDRVEQIEVTNGGTNHQWSYREGSLGFTQSYLLGNQPRSIVGESVPPFYEYDHADQDYCIVGGVVYRGHRFPELAGRYLFGDNQSGRIWSIDAESTDDRRLLLQLPAGKANSSLTSISVDNEGRIFFTHFASGASGVAVHELTRSVHPNWPDRLSGWPFFGGVQQGKAVDGFVDYEVNSPLWSDGLEKRRLLATPQGSPIGNSRSEYVAWEFPAGTVFVKHFYNSIAHQSAEFAAGDSVVGRPVETRVLVAGDGHQVYGASYVWGEFGDDAMLTTERQTVALPVPASAGYDMPTMEYTVPSSNDCLVCHNRDNPVIGVNALQLNRAGADVGGTNQLVAWSRSGLLKFGYEEKDVQALGRLIPPHEAGGGLEARARSYLHANCSFCHYPQGTQRTEFDARFTVALDASKMIGSRANTGYVSIDGRRASYVIVPGSPERSALFLRLKTLDRERAMPYLGRCSIDVQGAELISEWISSMRP